MLFLPDAILDEKERLLNDIESAKADKERHLKRMLELDPNDALALVLLGALRADAGDRAAAEELYWRAVRAQPCGWPAYQELSRLLRDQEPLSKGLFELGCRKLLCHETAVEDIEDSGTPFPWSDMPGFEDLNTRERFEALADALRLQRELEPVSVTALLRPYRLIHQVQVTESLDHPLVDALVQEGASLVPLLTGVVRGWVQDAIPEDDIFAVENSLALLGEIGETSAIPELLEMSTLEDPELSGPSNWALNRIAGRHPEEAARVIGEIAPGLDGGARIRVAEILIRNPKLDPKGALFERLFEKFDRLGKADRDACFPALMTTGIMLQGRGGVEAARSLLRRLGGQLSRDVRRDCDEMIEEFGSSRLPPPQDFEPSPWTVYQICNGEVEWEDELEDEEEFEDEEEYSPPEPIRRKFTPGRNDPCWCGSGKKYKKCHLEADEQEQRAAPESRASGMKKSLNEFDKVRREVGEVLSAIPEDEKRIGLTEFFGSDKPDMDTGVALLVDWTVHDRISERFGRTVMEEYLHRNRSRLTERERQFVESSVRSYIDLLEVQEVKEGSGMEVKSLTSGESFFVHEISLTKVISRWDGLQARVINGERGLEFSGVGSQIRREHLEPLRKWMEEDKGRTGLSWPVYLKRNWPRIRARGIEIADEWVDTLRIANNDGEEMVISKALYRVVNRGALIASLRSSVEIDENEEGTSFVWLDGPAGEEGHTLLGNMRVVGSELTLECNSRQRLMRGKAMLGELAGSAIKFQKEEFTTQEEIKRSVKENPRPAKSPPAAGIPPDVERMVVGQYMEKHYEKWLDMKLPALDGKTPRQAVKNAAGRRKVEELLKKLENDEERNRKDGKYAYDVNRIRVALEIEE